MLKLLMPLRPKIYLNNISTIVINRVILTIAFLLILPFTVLSQNKDIKFKHLSSDDGLSQNFVSSILQDQKGFMWFGTKDGLNRYDGHTFVVYQHDPFDSSTISENYITALYEDSRGYIWVGTLKGGLNCFLRETETFIRINFRSHTNENNNLNEIKSIITKGCFWKICQKFL